MDGQTLSSEEREENFASHSWRSEEETIACTKCGAEVADEAAIYPCGYGPQGVAHADD